MLGEGLLWNKCLFELSWRARQWAGAGPFENLRLSEILVSAPFSFSTVLRKLSHSTMWNNVPPPHIHRRLRDTTHSACVDIMSANGMVRPCSCPASSGS